MDDEIILTPEQEAAHNLLHDVWCDKINIDPDSLEAIILQALEESLDDVFCEYIPLLRVYYAFFDAYDSEELNVPPQKRIVGTDEETDKQRKILYRKWLENIAYHLDKLNIKYEKLGG